jgi:hypothetical protein
MRMCVRARTHRLKTSLPISRGLYDISAAIVDGDGAVQPSYGVTAAGPPNDRRGVSAVKALATYARTRPAGLILEAH